MTRHNSLSLKTWAKSALGGVRKFGALWRPREQIGEEVRRRCSGMLTVAQEDQQLLRSKDGNRKWYENIPMWVYLERRRL